MRRMNEKIREDNLNCFINCMNKHLEGTISVDENGNRWIFRNGRWEAMCYIEPIEFEPENDNQKE